MSEAKFSMRRFLKAHWADDAKLVQFVQTYGVDPPTRMAVHKWFERETVPTSWFAILVVLLEMERGKPISLTGFME